MKQELRTRSHTVSHKQLNDYFITYGKIEKEKRDSKEKVIADELNKVTKGKNIIVSNKSNK